LEKSDAMAWEGSSVRRGADPASGIAWLQYHRYSRSDGRYRRLPLPWATLVVTLGAAGRWSSSSAGWRPFPRLAIRGHTDCPSFGEDSGGAVEYVAALIEPWLLQQLFGVPPRLFKNDVVDLREFWGPGAERLGDLLEQEECPGGKLGLLEQYLIGRSVHCSVDTRVRRYMAICRRAAGSPRIVEAAQASGVSDRQLRRLVSDVIGFSPKHWGRLERCAAHVRQLHPSSWGYRDIEPPDYFDQAHAISQFRSFTGLTPAAYSKIKADGDPRVFMTSEA
jgi:AraC-like DNA-binding protein